MNAPLRWCVIIESRESDGPMIYGPWRSKDEADRFADNFNARAERTQDQDDSWQETPTAYAAPLRPKLLRPAYDAWSI